MRRAARVAGRLKPHGRSRWGGEADACLALAGELGIERAVFITLGDVAAVVVKAHPHDLRRTRHKAISNLRARATIIVLRFLPPSVRVRYHWANALSF